MDRLVQVSRAQLETQLRERFARYMGQIMDAVNAAPDGRLIEGSEVQVHDLMRQFEQEVYQTALQARIDSTESSFSPSAIGNGPPQAQQGTGPQQSPGVAGAGAVVTPTLRGWRRRARGSGG
jgi:hypothetical protein